MSTKAIHTSVPSTWKGPWPTTIKPPQQVTREVRPEAEFVLTAVTANQGIKAPERKAQHSMAMKRQRETSGNSVSGTGAPTKPRVIGCGTSLRTKATVPGAMHNR